MEFRLLGPLDVRKDGVRVPLEAAKPRAFLAFLLLNANRVVERHRLIAAVWEQPPPSATQLVHVYVSRLRKLLPEGMLVTRPPGYVLRVDPAAVDLARFERLLDEARGAAPMRASELLRDALSLWRGPPLAEFAAEPFALPEARRLAELRLGAVEAAIDADLALGRHAEATAELEALVVEEPHRESLRAQLMLALYRSGRQADALRVYQDTRAALDELGLAPGERLRSLERQILVHDEALDLRSARPLLGGPAELPAQLVPEPRSPLVGRDAALALLRRLLERAGTGRGSVVLLSAEAGGGKTRLARELAREAVAGGSLVLYGAADPVVHTPYQLLTEWLEFVARVGDRDALGRLLPAGSSELARLAPSLPGHPTTDRRPDEPSEERRRLHAAAVDLLLRMSEAHSLLLIADDLQWAETGTLHFVRRLARAVPTARVLLIVAYRDHERSPELDETLADLARLDWTTRLPLERLSPDDLRAFIAAAAGAEASEALVTAIAGLTAGTPLLVCELWRHLVENDGVEIAAGRAGATATLADVRSPENVRDLVRQRLARLPASTVMALELAAVAGARVDVRMLARAGGFDAASLGMAVEEGARAAIIEELPAPAQGIQFAHELIRRGIYDGVNLVRRAEMHGRVATALEELNPADPMPVLAELAYHFTQAAALLGSERAVEYNLRAADAAVAAVAFDDAARHLETALELGIADAQLQRSIETRLAYLLNEAGRAADSVALFESRLASSTGVEQEAEKARLNLIPIGRSMGDPRVDPAEMRAAAEQAIAIFTSAAELDGLPHANRILGMALRRQGRLAECCAAAERALASAAASTDPANRRRAAGTLCYALCDGPAPVPAAIERCEEIRASALGDRLLEAFAELALAHLQALTGSLVDANALLARSLRAFAGAGRMKDFQVYRVLIAETMILLGDLEGAEAELRTKWQFFHDLGDFRPDARAMHSAYRLALLYSDQGRLEEADGCLEYGREVPIPPYFLHESVLRLEASARLAAARGDLDGAASSARRAVDLAEQSDFLMLRASAWSILAEIEAVRGDEEAARGAQAAAAALADAKGVAAGVAH